jgi:hypothetical protein
MPQEPPHSPFLRSVQVHTSHLINLGYIGLLQSFDLMCMHCLRLLHSAFYPFCLYFSLISVGMLGFLQLTQCSRTSSPALLQRGLIHCWSAPVGLESPRQLRFWLSFDRYWFPAMKWPEKCLLFFPLSWSNTCDSLITWALMAQAELLLALLFPVDSAPPGANCLYVMSCLLSYSLARTACIPCLNYFHILSYSLASRQVRRAACMSCHVYCHILSYFLALRQL